MKTELGPYKGYFYFAFCTKTKQIEDIYMRNNEDVSHVFNELAQAGLFDNQFKQGFEEEDYIQIGPIKYKKPYLLINLLNNKEKSYFVVDFMKNTFKELNEDLNSGRTTIKEILNKNKGA